MKTGILILSRRYEPLLQCWITETPGRNFGFGDYSDPTFSDPSLDMDFVTPLKKRILTGRSSLIDSENDPITGFYSSERNLRLERERLINPCKIDPEGSIEVSRQVEDLNTPYKKKTYLEMTPAIEVELDCEESKVGKVNANISPIICNISVGMTTLDCKKFEENKIHSTLTITGRQSGDFAGLLSDELDPLTGTSTAEQIKRTFVEKHKMRKLGDFAAIPKIPKIEIHHIDDIDDLLM
jgi:hypothetical protein